MEWSVLLPWIGLALLVCVLLPLAAWYARRTWLARSGGMFACELNLGDRDHSRWVLGFARYSGEYLEWFRALSLALRPQYTFRRSATTARGAGPGGSDESLGGQRKLLLDAAGPARSRTWELVLDADSATGLLAWLEAAPPSVDRFKT